MVFSTLFSSTSPFSSCSLPSSGSPLLELELLQLSWQFQQRMKNLIKNCVFKIWAFKKQKNQHILCLFGWKNMRFWRPKNGKLGDALSRLILKISLPTKRKKRPTLQVLVQKYSSAIYRFHIFLVLRLVKDHLL